MKKTSVCLSIIVIVCVFLLNSPVSSEDSRLFRLPSGKVIKVLGIGKIYLAQSKRWVLNLDYETNISIDELTLLRQEVEEIWPVFIKDVERTDLKLASINANEPRRGFIIKENRSYRFVWEKAPDGNWKPW